MHYPWRGYLKAKGRFPQIQRLQQEYSFLPGRATKKLNRAPAEIPGQHPTKSDGSETYPQRT